MKLPQVGAQVIAPVILILSLSACNQAPSQTSAGQTQPGSDQAQKIRQMVEGAMKLKKELAIGASPPSNANLNPTPAQSGKPPEFLDPGAIESFTKLAKLYDDKDAPANHKIGAQESARVMERFFADQSECTLAFAYQMRGDYQKAAEVIKNRIASLEASNQDGSKAHRLAVCYAQYADYLNHLGRSGEAQQMLARARAIEPNHY